MDEQVLKIYCALYLLRAVLKGILVRGLVVFSKGNFKALRGVAFYFNSRFSIELKRVR
ncbi:hypothetical protein [Bartonella tribocorum]|uniref:hypothetical protein n=1 Tax=Bartonella tribocorum TaxID=85701 RepID=UPI0015E01094|nr:hypothetical protein [Bartonella tribocorum]